MATAHPHHRSEEFSGRFTSMLKKLAWLWDTDGEVVFVTGSGTAGMEASLRTCLRASDRIVAVGGGKFAERWVEICRDISPGTAELEVRHGASATAAGLDAVLDAQPSWDALVLVASETSTGALHPVAELVAAFRRRCPGGLVIVDGITAVGCVDLSMRRDGIDVLVSGTQKSFGVPPGGAMVGFGPKVQDWMDRPGSTVNLSLDLRGERKQFSGGDSAFTPSVPLVLALDEVMTRWMAFGREALFEHQRALSAGTIAGVRACGLELFAPSPSPALTSIAVPDGVAAARVIDTMRSRYGITVTGGQDAMKGRVIRIGHLGAVDAVDVIASVTALELALIDQGRPLQPGAAAAAAVAAMAGAMQRSPIRQYNP
jgi:aspartate aminotransferase-like enzyme